MIVEEVAIICVGRVRCHDDARFDERTSRLDGEAGRDCWTNEADRWHAFSIVGE